MLARDFQSVSIHKSCYERSRRFFFASRRISTIRARFEFWRVKRHPVLFHRLGRRKTRAVTVTILFQDCHFHSFHSLQTCKPSFSNKKKHVATDFLLVYFFQELSGRLIYIYIIYSRYWCWATLPPIQGIIDSTASEINDTVEEEIW